LLVAEIAKVMMVDVDLLIIANGQVFWRMAGSHVRMRILSMRHLLLKYLRWVLHPRDLGLLKIAIPSPQIAIPYHLQHVAQCIEACRGWWSDFTVYEKTNRTCHCVYMNNFDTKIRDPSEFPQVSRQECYNFKYVVSA
jgi:hypothetical protein